MSSAGLRSLLFAAKQMKSQDGGFWIYAINDDVKEVFNISGFVTNLDAYVTKSNALKQI